MVTLLRQTEVETQLVHGEEAEILTPLEEIVQALRQEVAAQEAQGQEVRNLQVLVVQNVEDDRCY